MVPFRMLVDARMLQQIFAVSKRVTSDCLSSWRPIYIEMESSLLSSFSYPRPACVSGSCWDLVLWLRAIYIRIGGSQLFIAGHNWRQIQGGRNGIWIRILLVGNDFMGFQLETLMFVMNLHFPGVISESCLGFFIPSSVPLLPEFLCSIFTFL